MWILGWEWLGFILPFRVKQKAREIEWCERGDLNPHGFPRQILSLVRLPIPPLSHVSHRLRWTPLNLNSFLHSLEVLTLVVAASARKGEMAEAGGSAIIVRPLCGRAKRKSLSRD